MLAGATCGAIARWDADGVRRRSLPIAWCPTYDSVRIQSRDWRPERRRILRTEASRCGDTTAVRFGYLR